MRTNNIVEPLASPQRESEISASIRKIVTDFQSKLIQSVQEQGVPDDARSFREMEENLTALSIQLASHVMAAILSVIHSRTVGTADLLPIEHAFRRHRSMGKRRTIVTFMSGLRMYFWTPYWARIVDRSPGRRKKDRTRGKVGSGIYPVLESLGIRWGNTPALVSRVAQLATRVASYKEASVSLASWGITISVQTIRKVTRNLGKAALKKRANRIREALQLTVDELVAEGELVGQRILIGVDGGRVRTRVPKRGKKPRKAKRQGYHGIWREPKLFSIHVVNRKGKKIKDLSPIYDVTLGDADAVFDLLIAELKLRGAAYAKQIIIVGDGALWIWDRIDRLVQELGINRKRVVEVLDFYHACEHLSDVAKSVKGWNDKKQKHWLRKMTNFLRKGDVDTVLNEIKRLCIGRRKKAIQTEFNYFQKNQKRMAYDDNKRRSIPCGSGHVESAIRRVINLRMKGNGIFWLENSAEEMLHLRAYSKAGRWDELLDRVYTTGPPSPTIGLNTTSDKILEAAA